jgi:hypothetical protein
MALHISCGVRWRGSNYASVYYQVQPLLRLHFGGNQIAEFLFNTGGIIYGASCDGNLCCTNTDLAHPYFGCRITHTISARYFNGTAWTSIAPVSHDCVPLPDNQRRDPANDPLCGTPATAYGIPRVGWPFHNYLVRLKTADPAGAANGFLDFSINGTTYFRLDGEVTPSTDLSVRLYSKLNGDIDSIWARPGSAAPGSYDLQGVPNDGNSNDVLATFEGGALDPGWSSWEVPPYYHVNGGMNDSGCASIHAGEPSIYAWGDDVFESRFRAGIFSGIRTLTNNGEVPGPPPPEPPPIPPQTENPPPTTTPPPTTPTPEEDECACPPPGGWPTSATGWTPTTGALPDGSSLPEAGGTPIGPPLGGDSNPCANIGGEAGVYPTAPIPANFTGSRDASLFVRIQNYDFVAAIADKHVWAVGQPIPDPPTHEEGYKKGAVTEISAIARSASNEQGDYVGAQVTFTRDDTDRVVRTLLASPGKQHLYGREASIRAYPSEVHRRARGAPAILFRGIVRDYPLGRRLRSAFAIEDLMASDIGAFGPGRVISDRKLTRGLFASIKPEKVGLHQGIIVGEVSDRGATVPGTGELVASGIVPLIDVGSVTIDGVRFLDMFVCGHAIAGIDLYARDSSNGFRVRIPESEYGTTVLAPGHTGYPYAAKYFDLTDTETGLVHRVTRVFVKEDSPFAISHLLNQILMTANVCGAEEDGDGLGRVVSDYFQAFQFIFDNWMLRSPGYYSGPYLGAPQWEDGTYMTKSASFVTAQNTSKKFIGGRGYIANFMIRDGLLSREVLKRFFVTAHCEGYWSREGQYCVHLPDDTEDITTAPRVREPVMVRAGIAPHFDVAQVENPVIFSMMRDYVNNRWRFEQQSVGDPIARARVGRERPSPNPIECWMSAHSATVRDAMSRRMLWRKYPVRPVEVITPIDGLDFEISQTIKGNSYDGLGAGYVDAPIRFRSVAYDHRQRRAVWQGIETSKVLQPTGFQLSDADSATIAAATGANFMLADPGVLTLR